VRVPERGDRIEPLLVGHDEQNVRPGHNFILSKAKNRGSIWIIARTETTRDVLLRST
jgi:hypothetical protein